MASYPIDVSAYSALFLLSVAPRMGRDDDGNEIHRLSRDGDPQYVATVAGMFAAGDRKGQDMYTIQLAGEEVFKESTKLVGQMVRPVDWSINEWAFGDNHGISNFATRLAPAAGKPAQPQTANQG